MERPIKGGYILISLGLIALSTSYSGSIDYDRISRTKKHIVLTGIKVGDTVMPDICVKPVYGNGTITFEDVYGFDVVVSSNNSVSVSESTVVPNVEKAPSGTIVDALGLDSDGKVVKGVSGGIKLYLHSPLGIGSGLRIISTKSTALDTSSSMNFVMDMLGSMNSGKIINMYVYDNSTYYPVSMMGDTMVYLKTDGTVASIDLSTLSTYTPSEIN